MAANKYLALIGNKMKEVFGLATSSGVADANKLVATDSTGRLDISLMPVGVGAETVVAVTSENLLAGDFVNLYSNGGVPTLRKADATTNTKPAYGFVQAATTSPAPATMFILGVNNSYVSGLTVGTEYVLSKSTPGGLTDVSTFVGTAGNVLQSLGIATATTNILTTDEDVIEFS